MSLKKIENIIVKYFSKSATVVELEELSKWLDKDKNKLYFKEYVKLNYYIDFNLLDFDLIEERKKILERTKIKKVRLLGNRLNDIYKYAAAILIFISVGYFFIAKDSQEDITPIIVNNNIKVGTDKATLTLEDGTDVILEKGQNYVANNLTSNGEEIVYNDAPAAKPEIAYNYLTIPRGGQYYVKLSDGTQVWLNSESKLKYPVSFIKGETRQVELVYGEAYFDVSPSTENMGMTFNVLSKMQEIEVLGTEFNVKAYHDETSTYTTLVEGKVSIDNKILKEALSPGQQSIISQNNNDILINSVQVKSEIAWKKGEFIFNRKPLKDIMKVLSRWYDMDVKFINKDIGNVMFTGTLYKRQSIEEILSLIKNTGFINTYKINNTTITLN